MDHEIEDGGPAFPVADKGAFGTYGMSLRDWFAAQASEADIIEHRHEYDGVYVLRDLTREQARYRYADAMLAARKTGGK